jgi:thymidylate synthase (FAD)
MDGLTVEKTAEFLDRLASAGHESPIEHASFTFGIEGVSRALMAQITRHRMASFSVQSQRYVSELNFEYIVPSEIEKIPKAKEEFVAAMKAAQKSYTELAGMLTEKHYAVLLEQNGIKGELSGKQKKRFLAQAEKRAIEDARFVLPNACDTKMIVTMNARSLMNFFGHRCCLRAQWEIRQVAKEMLDLVKEVAPNIFEKAGPPCLYAKCPEGAMSCGQSGDVRKAYGVELVRGI